jgi:uncharacterized protein YbjT (DUF2867 family)
MFRKVLVTGATGRLGRLVVSRLRTRAKSVKVAARRLERVAGFPKYGFDVVYLDYDLPASWERALGDVGAMLLVPPVVDPHADARLAPFVDRAVELGVGHVVLVSHLRAFRAEEGALGRLERHVRARARRFTILRPNWLLQDFTEGFLATAMDSHGLLAAPAGDGRVTFVDARDVADVAVKALFQVRGESAVHTLTGPNGLSFGAMAALASLTRSRSIRYLDLHESAFERLLRDPTWPPERLALLASRMKDVREGRAEVFTDDVARLLGRPPRSAADFFASPVDADEPVTAFYPAEPAEP